MPIKRATIVSATLALVVALGAIYQLTHAPSNPNDPDLSPLKVGSANYPVETPNPTHVIPFVVSRAELSNYHFDARYQTDAKLCSDHVALGVYLPHYLAIPIALSRDEGELSRGSFAIDKFQPGKCGWEFTGITYSSPGEPGVSLGPLAKRPDASPPAVPHVDMWCYKVTTDQTKLPEPRCEVLAFLRWPNADRRLNPEFLSRFSQEQQSDNGAVGITTNTENFTLELHDLNSTPGALLKVGDRAEQISAADEFRAAYEASPEAKVEPCFQSALGAYLRSHPETAQMPAGAEVTALKNKCRAEFGLAPEIPKY
jgi:hypothetical protein